MSPKLTVIAGPGHGTTYQISGDRFSIGRDPQNHFSIQDNSVSREHCVIVREDGGFFIRDLRSHNGTLVNDLPVLDQLLDWRTGQIRALFESNGLTLYEWEKERTDRVKVSATLLEHAQA